MAGHRGDADDRRRARGVVQPVEQVLDGDVAQRGRLVTVGAAPARPAGSAEGFGEHVVEQAPRDAGLAGHLQRLAHLVVDLALPEARRVESRGDQKEVLDGSLADPGRERSLRLARFGSTPQQSAEDAPPVLADIGPAVAEEGDLHPVAGADVDQLGDRDLGGERRQTRDPLALGQRQARHQLGALGAGVRSYESDSLHRSTGSFQAPPAP